LGSCVSFPLGTVVYQVESSRGIMLYPAQVESFSRPEVSVMRSIEHFEALFHIHLPKMATPFWGEIATHLG
jgi:hypothetical protein